MVLLIQKQCVLITCLLISLLTNLTCQKKQTLISRTATESREKNIAIGKCLHASLDCGLEYKVNANSLVLRSKPDANSTQISLLAKDQRIWLIENTYKMVHIDNTHARWYKVMAADEKVGYVYSGYIELMEP